MVVGNSSVERKKREFMATLGGFGEIYFPEDVKIAPEDLIGLDKQRDYLDSFIKTIIFMEKNEAALPIPLRLSALLIGPPGTGKTSMVKALASRNNIPVLVVFSNTLIASLLGESLQRIKKLLRTAEDFARKNGAIIIFFDEIDALASERANKNEVGEIKRTVISFLQELDLILEKELPIGIIGATNHPDQLDRAAWRRFTLKLTFPRPGRELLKKIILHFISKISRGKFIVDFGPEDVVDVLTDNFTGADIERAFQIAIFKALQNSIRDKIDTVKITAELFKDGLDFVRGEADKYTPENQYSESGTSAPEEDDIID